MVQPFRDKQPFRGRVPAPAGLNRPHARICRPCRGFAGNALPLCPGTPFAASRHAGRNFSVGTLYQLKKGRPFLPSGPADVRKPPGPLPALFRPGFSEAFDSFPADPAPRNCPSGGRTPPLPLHYNASADFFQYQNVFNIYGFVNSFKFRIDKTGFLLYTFVISEVDHDLLLFLSEHLAEPDGPG